MANPINVKNPPYNAAGNGTGNDGPAIQLALEDAIKAGNCRVIVPGGVYRITAPISVAMTLNPDRITSIGIIGDGADVTEFRFIGAPNGFNFDLRFGNYWGFSTVRPGNGLFFEGFSVTTDNNGTGVGFAINGGSQSGSDPRKTYFRDITFRGHEPSARWEDMVRLTDCAAVWFDCCRWFIGEHLTTSNGVNIIGTASGEPTVFNFVHCEAWFGDNFIKAGNWVEGIALTNCVHVGGNRAVQWLVTGGESGLYVQGGHFNNKLGNFYLDRVYDFTITGAQLNGMARTPPDTFRAIRCDRNARFAITGNHIQGTNTGDEIGILIENSQTGLEWGPQIIAGNAFSNLTGYGISLGTGSATVTVADNAFHNCGIGNIIDIGVGNYVRPRTYAASIVILFAGGTSAIMNVPIPPGIFRSKPASVIIQSAYVGFPIFGFYDWSNASSTATNVVVEFREINGNPLPTGHVRFSMTAEG